jgi:hypothetical protein
MCAGRLNSSVSPRLKTLHVTGGLLCSTVLNVTKLKLQERGLRLELVEDTDE